MRSSTLFAVMASISAAAAVSQGFNYGSTNPDGSYKDQATYTAEFTTAQNLVGTSGFTSARLYTMIQGGTANTPISAIPAAISTKTTLLLGLWASAGQAGIDNEIAALKAAIATYGTAFTSLVTGISVGSEDLYRISPTGIAALSGYGAEPATLVSYIGQVRAAIAGTSLSGASIGHVDTWTAWVNGTNTAVINAVDWVGMDAYPYFQNTQANSIANGKGLFYDALGATQAAVGGKEVWITETGWPVTGPTQGQGVPGTAAAKTYWDEVGCPSFGKVNIYWYTLQDAPQASTSPSFGIVGSTLSTTPLYDLSCAAVASSSSAAASPSTVAPSPSNPASSSIIASASSVISSAIVSSGGGLSPTNGNGVDTSIYATTTKATTASSSSPVVTVTATGSPSSSTLTTSVVATTIPSNITTTRTSGSSSSTTASASTTAFTGAANAVSGSLFGLVGALAAAFAAF